MTKKDYSGLEQTFEYDETKAELLAEAMTELMEIEARKQYLVSLLDTNKGLKRFLWQSQDGKVIAFHKIDDDYLVNILNYLYDNGRDISKPLIAEARKRKIAIPTEPKMLGDNSSLVW